VRFDHTGSRISFTNGENILLVATVDGSVMATALLSDADAADKPAPRSICFSPDGRCLAVSGRQCHLPFRTTSPLAVQAQVGHHQRPISSIFFSVTGIRCSAVFLMGASVSGQSPDSHSRDASPDFLTFLPAFFGISIPEIPEAEVEVLTFEPARSACASQSSTTGARRSPSFPAVIRVMETDRNIPPDRANALVDGFFRSALERQSKPRLVHLVQFKRPLSRSVLDALKASSWTPMS
jgi:hypothetical protein